MKEAEVIKILDRENEEFRRLDEEHRGLEERLGEFDGRVYLSSEEEFERKKVQKLKLRAKDRMAELMREYRSAHPAG